MTGSVREFTPAPATPVQSSGGNGNRKELYARVSALEAEIKHLATKKDIADFESNMQRWLMRTMIAIMSGMVTVIIGLVAIVAKSLT